MRLFDLHCDTITTNYKEGRDLLSRESEVSLEDGACLKNWVQTFAIFIPDEYRGEDAVAYFNENLAFFHSQLKAFPHLLCSVQSNEDLSKLPKQSCGGILSVEGGAVLAGDTAKIPWLAQQGVRILTLTWNGKNELGYGCLENKGLTPVGIKALPLLEQHGITIDVSHLSEKGFWDVAAHTTLPFIATHSNAKTICNHPRNLTDEQFRCMVERKGLVGLNLHRDFLSENGVEASFSQLEKHLRHFLSLGGENTVAMGSDFDGATIDVTLSSPQKLCGFYPYLLSKGYSKTVADKLFFENAFSFFQKRWTVA